MVGLKSKDIFDQVSDSIFVCLDFLVSHCAY